LTIPEGTTVSDACRRMAARRVDAVLLTDAQGLLSGIVTDKVVFFFIFLIFWMNLMVIMCTVVPFIIICRAEEKLTVFEFDVTGVENATCLLIFFEGKSMFG